MAQKAHNLGAKLKQADPAICAYVAELERRNQELQGQLADGNNRIKALLADLDKGLKLASARIAPRPFVLHKATSEQALARIRELEEKLGIPIEERFGVGTRSR
jgi:hypothetical protein